MSQQGVKILQLKKENEKRQKKEKPAIRGKT